MLRDPDRMTTEERDAEVAHLLGKALLRIHHENKQKAKGGNQRARTSTAPPNGNKDSTAACPT